MCVYINTHTYTQKHIHTFTHYMHTYSQKYILTYSHTHTHKSHAAGAGHLAHPARPTSVRALGGHTPDDQRRAPNFPFQASLSKASTHHVPRSPALPCPPARRPGALLAALPPVLLPPGPSKCRTKCHHPQSRQSPHRSPKFLWVFGAGLGRPGLA